jgi:hypothetical protein
MRNLRRGQMTRMMINSGGGDTKPGVIIGSIVDDLKPEACLR